MHAKSRAQALLLASCAVGLAGCSSSGGAQSASAVVAPLTIVLTNRHPAFTTNRTGAYEVILVSSGCPIGKASGYQLSLVGRTHGERLVDHAGPPPLGGMPGLPGKLTLPADTWTVTLTAAVGCAPWDVTVQPSGA